MSSLQESVDARRAARPTAFACVELGSPSSSLIVELWQGDRWVLPWSHLTSASLREDDGGDVLVLSFTGALVRAQGNHLNSLLPDLANFRVTHLRNLPTDYRSQLPRESPFVSRLEVQPVQTTGGTPG